MKPPKCWEKRWENVFVCTLSAVHLIKSIHFQELMKLRWYFGRKKINNLVIGTFCDTNIFAFYLLYFWKSKQKILAHDPLSLWMIPDPSHGNKAVEVCEREEKNFSQVVLTIVHARWNQGRKCWEVTTYIWKVFFQCRFNKKQNDCLHA